MIWFTSDHHFYHESRRDPNRGIIPYCNRPFTNMDTMVTALIRNYNDLVGVTDTVYFVGDLVFNTHWTHVKALLDRMNGQKILVRGNHDQYSNKKYKDCGFSEVAYQLWVEGYLVVHSPADNYFNCKCICGHVHEHWRQQGKTVNVSVDAWDFRPVSLNQINEIFKNMEV